MTPKQKQEFINMVYALEPENISCDGEASITQQRRFIQKIAKDWRKLEKQVGHKVSETEAGEWMLRELRFGT